MSSASVALQDTLSEARETLQAYECDDVPGEILPAIDTKMGRSFRFGYFNGREVSKEVTISVWPVKKTTDYYLADIDLEQKDTVELYLLETDDIGSLEEELIDIPNIAYTN